MSNRFYNVVCFDRTQTMRGPDLLSRNKNKYDCTHILVSELPYFVSRIEQDNQPRSVWSCIIYINYEFMLRKLNDHIFKIQIFDLVP